MDTIKESEMTNIKPQTVLKPSPKLSRLILFINSSGANKINDDAIKRASSAGVNFFRLSKTLSIILSKDVLLTRPHLTQNIFASMLFLVFRAFQGSFEFQISICRSVRRRPRTAPAGRMVLELLANFAPVQS